MHLLNFLPLLFIPSTTAFPSFAQLWPRNDPTPPSYNNDNCIQPNPHKGHWVDTWVSMPQLTEYYNLPPPPFNESGLVFPNSTIRQTLRMTIPAEQIRIRFSNAFGGADLPITHATVAFPRPASPSQNRTGASGVETETLQSLTFSGEESITVSPGALAVSDPLNFPIQTGQIITVSMYLRQGQASNYITSHPGSRTRSWFSSGDYTSAANMTDPSTQQAEHWFYVSAVEAWQTPAYRSLVVVGDSITDGRGSYINTNTQWPNLLFNRLQLSPSIPPASKKLSILNQAAGGNRVLEDGLGPSASARLDRDVLAQPGTAYALIFSGVNDIGTADPTPQTQSALADRLIQTYAQLITRLHASSLPVFGATITPFGCPNSTLQPYSDPVRERTRLQVNDWIRHSGAFDAVVDFDAILRDPRNVTQLAPWYDSGDCLHPGPAGYRALAEEFPVEVFERFRGGVRGFV